MTKKKVPEQAKTERKRYSPEFKQQALLRAVKDGVPMAARDLGLEPAQLYAWRAKAQQHGQDAEVLQLQQSEVTRLKRELARLEEDNAFLKKAAAYFAKQPK
jgi:transposase